MKDEIRKEHEARRVLLEIAREKYYWREEEYKRKVASRKASLKLPKDRSRWPEKKKEIWRKFLLRTRKAHERWLINQLQQEERASRAAEWRAQKAEKIEAKKQREAEHIEKVRLIKEKYGFTLGKKPITPEEIEGRRRYQLNMDAEMRNRRREEIRVYNREYRKRKRAEALEAEQAKWSSEEWERFEKKQEKKRNPKGSPQWFIKEVVRYLSQAQQMPEEVVTEKLIELGGMDFLVKGAESMGEQRCGTATMVLAAVRALALYLDPESAVMFGVRDGKRKES